MSDPYREEYEARLRQCMHWLAGRLREIADRLDQGASEPEFAAVRAVNKLAIYQFDTLVEEVAKVRREIDQR
jgi:hypothetical protein